MKKRQRRKVPIRNQMKKAGAIWVTLCAIVVVVSLADNRSGKSVTERSATVATMLCFGTVGLLPFRKKQKHKQSKSNNCNGCLRQNECEYGYYTYDSVDGRQWALWEKFMRASNLEFNMRTPEQREYISQFSKQRQFSRADIPWLSDYLEIEQSDYNKIRQFGKCGPAYAGYMRLKGGVENIENALNKAKAAPISTADVPPLSRPVTRTESDVEQTANTAADHAPIVSIWKNILKTALKVLGAIWFLVGFVMAIRIAKSDSYSGAGSSLLYVVLTLLVLGVGCVGLWPFWKWGESRRRRRPQIGRNLAGDTFYHIEPEPEAETASNTTTKKPPVTLRAPHFHNGVDVNNNVRILQDCIDILRTTTNFETFFSRAELGREKALVLQEAGQAARMKQVPQLVQLFSDVIAPGKTRLLQDAYNKTFNDTQLLKTARGKLNHWEKLLVMLNRYEFELEVAEGYPTVRDLVEKQIAELQNPFPVKLKIESAVSSGFTEEQLDEILPTGNTWRQQIEIGVQHAMERNKQSPNPVFHRSLHDEDLSFEFSEKYTEQISKLEKYIYTDNFAITKLSVDELYEQIDTHETAIESFDELREFCYAHGKGGKIYFQDKWEYCHNSKNPCFSFKDTLTETLEKLNKHLAKKEASRESANLV